MANRIRFLREERGVTQTELGSHFNLSKTAISYYENGRRDIVSTDYLLCRTERRYILEPMTLQVEDGKTKTITYLSKLNTPTSQISLPCWKCFPEAFYIYCYSDRSLFG